MNIKSQTFENYSVQNPPICGFNFESSVFHVFLSLKDHMYFNLPLNKLERHLEKHEKYCLQKRNKNHDSF